MKGKIMRKVKLDKIEKFLLFAFPCYWSLAFLFIVLVAWKVRFSDPDVITTMIVSVSIIVAAVLLVNNHYWVSIPMIILGIYIARQEDQFIGPILDFYGAYLILHYLVCGVLVYKKNRNG